MYKFPITSAIAYYLDQNWVLQEVQLACDKGDNLFFSYIKC